MMGMEDKSHQWWRLKRQVINGEDYKKLLGEVIGSNESLFINTSLHHVIRVGTCKHPHILLSMVGGARGSTSYYNVHNHFNFKTLSYS